MFSIFTSLATDHALDPLQGLRQRAENIYGDIREHDFRLCVYRRGRGGWSPSVILVGRVESHLKGSRIRVTVLPHWSVAGFLLLIGLSIRWGGDVRWLLIPLFSLLPIGGYVWEVFDAHRLLSQIYSSNQALQPTAGRCDSAGLIS